MTNLSIDGKAQWNCKTSGRSDERITYLMMSQVSGSLVYDMDDRVAPKRLRFSLHIGSWIPWVRACLSKLWARPIRGEALGPGVACPNARPCYLAEIPSTHASDSARMCQESRTNKRSHGKSLSPIGRHVSVATSCPNLPAHPQVALLYLHATLWVTKTNLRFQKKTRCAFVAT